MESKLSPSQVADVAEREYQRVIEAWKKGMAVVSYSFTPNEYHSNAFGHMSSSLIVTQGVKNISIEAPIWFGHTETYVGKVWFPDSEFYQDVKV
ncbi:hypothetical protein H6G33_09755 [Calothrix sp. FACHB-1219]|uniref:hypothetical protein n=1 Tax=unclassified Calothrix TaxID=2619626 RepID=UPI001686FB69|nr:MULTISPECIES: hypothetical protein [unclassified Calothrix]MBD2201631.1 hypothetical protein [Calothrix sp. FACHB-168]MBD2217317.1 hypothetical protein [Calothrix sp. FACHB-1219]